MEYFNRLKDAVSDGVTQAQGGSPLWIVIILIVAINNLPIFQYTPTAVKKTITGNGKADKPQVQKMLNILLTKHNFLDNDQSDALAVAFCHYQHQNFPKYAKF